MVCSLVAQAPDVVNFCHNKYKYPRPNNTVLSGIYYLWQKSITLGATVLLDKYRVFIFNMAKFITSDAYMLGCTCIRC